MSGIGFISFVLAMFWSGLAQGQDLTALARIDAQASSVKDVSDGARLELALSQPIPYRVFTLDAPPRLVLDFAQVDWTGLNAAAFDQSDAVISVATGLFRPGWSRMVLELADPLLIASAGMNTSQGALVSVDLTVADSVAFAAASGAPQGAVFQLPEPEITETPRTRYDGTRPLIVMLDPGHGGIDPGAERDGVQEANLMLTFAKELQDVLLRAGGFEVWMTRDEDIFVPLEMRQSLARAAGADVFISLHTDAIAVGRARGATIYTLSDEASDIASAKLAERHDRGDLLAGVDLTDHDDVVASVLMDLARMETAPRSDRLADALVEGLSQRIGNLHKRPRLEASFSVLKAPDIPSVLIELGLMSSQADLRRLRSEEWRANAALGIRDALQAWAKADAEEAKLLRQ